MPYLLNLFGPRTLTVGIPFLNARYTSVQSHRRCGSDPSRIRRNGSQLSGLYFWQQTEASDAIVPFNSLTGDLFLPDPEGEELPNVDSARKVAEQSAREALIEAIKTGTRLPIAFRLPIARVAR
jgi:hypothetical protein